MSGLVKPTLKNIIEIETIKNSLLGSIVKERHIGMLSQQVDKGDEKILRVTLSRSSPMSDFSSYVHDAPYLSISTVALEIGDGPFYIQDMSSAPVQTMDLSSVLARGERVLVRSPFFKGKEDEYEYHIGYFAGKPILLSGDLLLAGTNIITSQKLKKYKRYNVLSIEAEIYKLIECSNDK